MQTDANTQSRRQAIAVIMPSVRRAADRSGEARLMDAAAAIERWMEGEVGLAGLEAAADAASEAADEVYSSAADAVIWAADAALWEEGWQEAVAAAARAAAA